MKNYSHIIWPIIGLSALIFCSWLLSRELADVSWSAILLSFERIPPLAFVCCFLSTLVAYAALAWYDRIALLHIGHKLSWVFISLTSFTTYAISHNMGMSMISGGLIRYRAYSSRGLTFPEVATLVLFCSFTFSFGIMLVAGGVLIIKPELLAYVLNIPPIWAWEIGVALILIGIFYGLGSLLRLPPVKWGHFKLVYPRPEIAIRQFFAAPIELLGAAGILYFALPPDVNPGYVVVLGVFLLSFSMALLSHAPGGLGVLELVFLKAMPDIPHAQLLTALLVFRLFYLILPLLFGICVALIFEHGHLREAWREVKTSASQEQDSENISILSPPCTKGRDEKDSTFLRLPHPIFIPIQIKRTYESAMQSRLDRSPLAAWWWTLDRWLLAAMITLMILGLLFALAGSPAVAERLKLPIFYFVNRQVFFLIPTLILMIAASFCSPRWVRRSSIILFFSALALIIVALYFGQEVKGARRWIFGIQPSEFIKPVFVILVAWAFSQSAVRRDVPGNWVAFLLLPLTIVPLLLEPDYGQTMLICLVWATLFFVAGLHLFWVSGIGIVGATGVLLAYKFVPHVRGRIMHFWDHSANGSMSDTFQVDAALESFTAGGWFGKGPGEGTVKLHLPDSHTDFIFAVTGEEFGILVCLALVAIFMFILMRGLILALRHPDPFSSFAAAGLLMLFGIQGAINMAVNLHLMPAKGMTLPFISYGGSSLVAMGLGMGFLLALLRKRPTAHVGHYMQEQEL